MSVREALLWSLVWIALSFVFCGLLWWYLDGTRAARIADLKAGEFLTGYLIEKSLSVDNVFVFLLIFTYFAVPQEYQKRVLIIGVVGAIVLRAIMILIGAYLIAQLSLDPLRVRCLPAGHRHQDAGVRRGKARSRREPGAALDPRPPADHRANSTASVRRSCATACAGSRRCSW